LLDVPGVGIVENLRVDVIDYRHPHRLVRLQRLPCEAEALDLVEIGARLRRGDVEGGCAGDRPVGIVACNKQRHIALTERDGLGHLQRLERPRHAALGLAIETDRDRLATRAPGELRDIDRLGFGHTLGGSGEPGHLTEQAVERHGGEPHAEHRQRHQHHQQAHAAVTALDGRGRHRSAADLDPGERVKQHHQRHEQQSQGNVATAAGALQGIEFLGSHSERPCPNISRSATRAVNSANK
jgi:hypothetical protein